MASKVLVNIPGIPFPSIQLKKSHSGDLVGGGVMVKDYSCRVAHLEHSIRFLQEQHQTMLRGLHKEIESLRERNRDLQFQLIFNKDSRRSPPEKEEKAEDAETSETARLGREAAAARGEARAAEARALQLQQLLDAQTERIRTLELRERGRARSPPASPESPEQLRARLAHAERLVTQLRSDADRQRRELRCMKNSLSTSLRVTGMELGYGNHGYRPHNYHFPPLPQEYWPEPPTEDFNMMGIHGRGRRPVTLPHLQTNGQQATVYANHYARPRPNGYEQHSERKRIVHQQSTGNEMIPTECGDGQNDPSLSQQTEYQMLQANNTTNSRHRGKKNYRRGSSNDYT